jgi:hypothetical protein
MTLNPYLITEFVHGFVVRDDEGVSLTNLPHADNDCWPIATDDGVILGYIRKDAAAIIVGILNHSRDEADKREGWLYRMAQVALASSDMCDEDDLVEMFEEIIAGRRE